MDRHSKSNANSSSGATKSARAQPMSPLAFASHATPTAQLVSGSPVNFRKQSPSSQHQQQHFAPASGVGSTSVKRPSQIHALPHSALGLHLVASETPDARSERRARPSTSSSPLSPALPPTSVSTTAAASSAAALSAKETLHVLLTTYQDGSEQQQQQQARPDSAPETRVRKQPASVAPLTATSPNKSSASRFAFDASALEPLSCLPQRQSQRCAGCGAFAEMCMGCFSRFKQQDGAVYKKQIARSVEVLFEKATARAFTKMSAVILQWLFGIWKTETQRNRRRRAAAVHAMERQRLHKVFTTWHECIYKRRIVGAMLYAENQQQVTREKNKEIALLHGEVFAVTSSASVQDHVHRDDLAKLQALCAMQQQSLAAKNQELLALRRETQDARDRVAVLEKQAVDPRELERIKTESVDYKKVAFQLATALFQTMETQVEQLATSEGRHNLLHMFTKETLQAIDKPECQAFYNPLVELESAPMAAATASATSGTPPADTSNASTTSTSFFTSYDAPTDRAEKILMQWVNALMQKHGTDLLPAPRMLNFHSSLSDGKLYVALTKVLHHAMSRVRPRRPPGVVSSKLEATSVLRENGEDLTEIAMERYLEHMRKEESPEKRLELMIGTIGQAMWLPVGLLNAKDILAGDAEFNFASLTYLFLTFSPCLDDAFLALVSDIKLQLSTAKAKWRELRDGTGAATAAPAVGGSTSSTHALKLQRATSASFSSSAGTKDSDDDATLSSKMKLVLAHTMELKRKVDAEDQKAREGHVLWWKSVRIVLRKCFLSYARLARGKAGVLTRLDASGDENDAFAKVPKHKLQDLELPFEDFAWEAKLLQSYLLTIYCDLARIYRGYASRNGVVNDVITLGDFTDLLTDCRVLDATFTVADVHSVLKKVDPKQTSMNTHRALQPLDFLEALIRVARKKYTAEHHRITLSEAFCLFTDTFILPYAFRADADLFRTQIEEPKIRRLLIKYGDELKDLYSAYATEDPKQHKTRKRARMTAFTFSQCLIDKGIQDVTFNSEKVLALLQKVVRTKRESESSGTSGGSGKSASGASSTLSSVPAVLRGASDDDELTFDEFEEAMIAIACHKFPDPYVSLESRVEKFLAFFVRGLRGDAAAGGGGSGSK